LVWLTGCSPYPSPQFSQYQKLFPDTEADNATLYREELLIKEVSKAYEAKKDMEVIKAALSFLALEGSKENTGALSFYLARSLSRAVQLPTFAEDYSHMDKNFRSALKVFSNPSGEYSYSNAHLYNLLEKNLDYEIEKKAAETLWLPQIRSAESSQELKTNLAILDFFSRRYPDASGLMDKCLRVDMFPIEEYATSLQKSNFYELVDFLKRVQIKKSEHETLYGLIAFNPIVRNRPSYSKGRILQKLRPWELVSVLETISNRQALTSKSNAESEWVRVRYRENYYGFIDIKAIKLISDQEKKSLAYRRIQKIADTFNHLDYLKAAELSSSLILSPLSDESKEIAYGMLHEANLRIAERATSLKNPYMNYVRLHLGYFRYSETKKIWTASDLLLRALAQVLPESRYVYELEKTQ
jgi:hypothetical protein